MEDKKHQPSNALKSAPFAIDMLQTLPDPTANESVVAFHPGDLCPKCHAGQLDYDGCLNLACPICGYTLGGCFT